jgi:hypothetical protein
MARELWTLLKDAQAEYLERRKDYPDEDVGDVMHEVADSHVPVYTADLMRLASEDIDLAVRVPECGPAFDGTPTPVNIVAANVYEMILEALAEVSP